MAVPEEIRRVPRPEHTVIRDSGTDSKYRYAVVYWARTGAPSGGSGPKVTTQVIGHIIDGAYVPKSPNSEDPTKVAYLEYGLPALIHSCCGSIQEELEELFPGQSNLILALVSLLIQYPTSSAELSVKDYPYSYVSRYFPCGPLTMREVEALLTSLEEKQEEIRTFCTRRVSAVPPRHHIVLSGIYDEGWGRNFYVDWVLERSRHRWLPMDAGSYRWYFLYAYDLEAREILCWQVFHPAPPDRQACLDFLETYGLDRGLVLTDPASLMRQIEGDLGSRPNLHPLALREPEEPEEKPVTNSIAEFMGMGELFASPTPKSRNRPAPEYDSDRTWPVKTVKSCSESRDLVECLLSRYDGGSWLTRWDPEASFPAAVEFLGLLAAMLSCRMVGRARSARLLTHRSFNSLMCDLLDIWRAPHAPDPPRTGDGYWLHMFPECARMLEKLGLADPSPGRPARDRGADPEEP